MKKFVFPLSLAFFACSHAPTVSKSAHFAEKQPHPMEKHGDVRVDDYYWMRERENPKVLKHLNDENDETNRALAPVAATREQLFLEMKSRIKEDDETAPIKLGNDWYLARTKAGLEHPIHLRRKGSSTGPEEILLDVNEVAKGHDYTRCTSPVVDDSQNLIAYGCDFAGRNFFTWRGRDLRTGKDLGFELKDVSTGFGWAADGKRFFYTRQDPETLREYQVWRFDLDTKKQTLVYEEKDPTFSIGLRDDIARRFLFISSNSTMTSETRFLDRRHPLAGFQVFLPRERGHEYMVFDGEDRFYVLTNWDAKDFRLMEAPVGDRRKSAWKDVIPSHAGTILENAVVFRRHIIAQGRADGLNHLFIVERGDDGTRTPREIPFPGESYVVNLADNAEYTASAFRYELESMARPPTTYDWDFETEKAHAVHVKDVPNFDASKYRTERIWITARDGQKLPISLLMRKERAKDARGPMLVYGYGSYGSSMEPYFSIRRLNLVDRGWVFALTHIRGGSELGRAHYENGRQMKKMNTFTDFIDSTEALVKLGYSDPRRVYAQGGSAGGLLMGAVMNLRPDLYHGIVAQVPFVDVLTTMLDDSIPLTTGEYDEWGNPNEKAAYEYMKQYSPYDNVRAVAYPHLLVTTGLHDSQVQYWEPAKWVAKIKAMKTNDSLTLLHTDMSAGHHGASGRYQSLKDDAMEQSFFLLVDQ